MEGHVCSAGALAGGRVGESASSGGNADSPPLLHCEDTGESMTPRTQLCNPLELVTVFYIKVTTRFLDRSIRMTRELEVWRCVACAALCRGAQA